MSEKLSHRDVTPIAHQVNRALGLSKHGPALVKRKCWIVGAVMLTNRGYGRWSIDRVTTDTGRTASVHEGRLRDCKAFLEGMKHTLSAGK